MYDPRAVIARRASSLETSAVLAIIAAALMVLALALLGAVVLFRTLPDRVPVAALGSIAWSCFWLVLLLPPAIAYAANLRFQAAMLRLQLMIEHNTRRTAEALESMRPRS
jgi:hypothetical protein